MGPTVTAVMNKETELSDQDLSAWLGHLDSKIMLQLWRLHRGAHQAAQLASPLGSIHASSP
jgi:hypothetical protein